MLSCCSCLKKQKLPPKHPGFYVKKFDNLCIYPGISGLPEDDNINGPCVIKVPDWIENPLGTYYMYFAHHGGKYIRMAYADYPTGPWIVKSGGVLDLDEAPNVFDHIASPEIFIMADQIVMYFHGRRDPSIGGQSTHIAISTNGLEFTAYPDEIALPYFRIIQIGEYFYGFAKKGYKGIQIYRGTSPLDIELEKGPLLLPKTRHVSLWLRGNQLYVFHSRIGDLPESILVSIIDIGQDWKKWKASSPQLITTVEHDYEGVDLPFRRSGGGTGHNPLHQLRDPYIFLEEYNNTGFLYYTVKGEKGIAMANIWYIG